MNQNNTLQPENTYDKILELIGPASIKNSFQHLNEGGIVCNTGQLGGKWYLEDFDPIFDIKVNSYLTSFYSDNVDGDKLNALLDYIQHYNIQIQPEKVFTLEDTPNAHANLEAHNSFGKVIVLNS
ncbi:zinc-binding dehydrogenase [Macrococcus sp. EM39E]|uniref:zinc-binding dehydrogenase n=1 Tax=Macrococcus animalis TaxID=3395467 RepID=UPI0039BE4C41